MEKSVNPTDIHLHTSIMITRNYTYTYRRTQRKKRVHILYRRKVGFTVL